MSGELAPGTRLPAERDLAERFGVNRVTVRAALGRLASEGLLRARQGSGHVVTDFEGEAGPALLPGLLHLAREEGDLPGLTAELLEVRRALARGLFERLLAHPPRRADLDEVGRAVVAFEARVIEGAPPNALAAADIAVLTSLLRAARSSVLRLCINPIVALLTQVPELSPCIYAEPESNAAAYRLLLAWLEAPQVEVVDVLLDELKKRDAQTVARLKRREKAHAPRASKAKRAP